MENLKAYSKSLMDYVSRMTASQVMMLFGILAGTIVGAIFVVYDHHQAKLAQKLIQLQHSHILHTISSMHVHIGHHECLEVILLKGKVGEITKLGEKIVSLKGVMLGKVNLIAAQ